MRSDVAFDAAGTTLRGWLYVPDGGGPRHPAVVMAHGFSAVKEMGLDDYAEVFCAAGLACLVYDHRNLGASDGTPRNEIDPVAQARDYRHAITFLASRPEVDAARIGVWGTSYSGGLVIIVGATDPRVKCVVSQVPFISGWDTLCELNTAAERAGFFAMLEKERAAVAAGATPGSVPVCRDPPTAAGRTSHAYFTGFQRSRGAPWENRVTIRSLEYRLEYEAMPYAGRLGTTPLLMILARDDRITPTRLAEQAFERASQPKKLVFVGEDHYDPYLGGFAQSSAEARDWFVHHLR